MKILFVNLNFVHSLNKKIEVNGLIICFKVGFGLRNENECCLDKANDFSKMFCFVFYYSIYLCEFLPKGHICFLNNLCSVFTLLMRYAYECVWIFVNIYGDGNQFSNVCFLLALWWLTLNVYIYFDPKPFERISTYHLYVCFYYSIFMIYTGVLPIIAMGFSIGSYISYTNQKRGYI